MVLLSGLIWLAHGADPTPLDWDEGLANLVKFAVTFLLIGCMSYPVLAPLFFESTSNPESKKNQDSLETKEEPESKAVDIAPPSATPETPENRDVVGWIAVALLVVLSMFWWVARSTLVEVMTEESAVKEDHNHVQTMGGQVAMWADFHAEVARIESGEIQIFLRDSYNRDISAKFYQARVLALPLEATPPPEEEAEYVATEESLNGTYRFLRAPREFQQYKIKIDTPGWTSSLRFVFDESKGRSSLPIWCSTR